MGVAWLSVCANLIGMPSDGHFHCNQSCNVPNLSFEAMALQVPGGQFPHFYQHKSLGHPTIYCCHPWTGNLYKAAPRLRECCRQVEAEEVSNSRNKIHQTWEWPYRDSMYLFISTHKLRIWIDKGDGKVISFTLHFKLFSFWFIGRHRTITLTDSADAISMTAQEKLLGGMNPDAKTVIILVELLNVRLLNKLVKNSLCILLTYCDLSAGWIWTLDLLIHQYRKRACNEALLSS